MSQTLHQAAQTIDASVDSLEGLALKIGLSEDQRRREAQSRRVRAWVRRSARLCGFGGRCLGWAICLLFVWLTVLGLAGFVSDVVGRFNPLADVSWNTLQPVSGLAVKSIVLMFLVGVPCVVLGGVSWLGWLKVAGDWNIEVDEPDLEADDRAAG